MIKYIYLHGFNSGNPSRSARELAQLLQVEFFCPQYDYSQTFETCLNNLERQIAQWMMPNDFLCICGTSLGAFYSLQLRIRNIKQIIGWNPVVFPAIQLGQFLGANTRFNDGVKWQFTRQTLLSYAAAPDGRQWQNFYWDQKNRQISLQDTAPERIIALGDQDELLDNRLTRAYWNNHATIIDISAGHQVADFSHILDIIIR